MSASDAVNVKDMGGFHQLFLRLQETTPIVPNQGSGVRVLIHERSEPAVLAMLTRGVNIELGCSREVKLELRKVRGYKLARLSLELNIETDTNN